MLLHLCSIIITLIDLHLTDCDLAQVGNVLSLDIFVVYNGMVFGAIEGFTVRHGNKVAIKPVEYTWIRDAVELDMP